MLASPPMPALLLAKALGEAYERVERWADARLQKHVCKLCTIGDERIG
jgi:hypothetical protein